MARTIPDVRITPDTSTVIGNLGLLGDLGGSWQGKGFNLIARPDFQGDAPLYLQLNQTEETLKIDPIGSPIPNRGFRQDDMELSGLTYLQKISDVPGLRNLLDREGLTPRPGSLHATAVRPDDHSELRNT